MFEQSILADATTGRKTGALFASASAQIAGVGVLLLIPLIYTEALPVARLPLTLPMPVSQVPESPAEIHVSRQTAHSRRFSFPFRISALTAPAIASPQETAIDTAAPQLTGTAFSPQPDAGVGLAAVHIEKPAEPPLAPLAEPVKPAVPAPIRVSGSVQAAKILRKVVPQYPPLARQARISGIVRLLGVIAKDGTVQRLTVISGHQLLQKAALDAVSQWLYQPTLLSGKPVEVLAPIDVIFTLSQ
jgi:protein TonB